MSQKQQSVGVNHLSSQLLEGLPKQKQNAGKVPHKPREILIRLFSCHGSAVEQPNISVYRKNV